MPANTTPIFTLTPNVSVAGSVIGPSANTALDGTGANSTLVFTAGANGSFVEEVIFKPVGSPTNTVARLFWCSATGTFTPGTTNTAANCGMLDDIALVAVTQSQLAGTQRFSIPVNKAIPASTKLFVTFGTSTGAAGTGYSVTAIGGDY